MMTANASHMNGFEGSSQSVSQTSSPTSPSASYHSYSHTAPAISASNARSVQESSRPGTPSSASNGPSLEPPSGTSFSEFISSWSDAHVARWLTDVKCERHASTFRANDIRGDVLLELDQSTLKEMGVSSIGDRLRIINAVKALRHKSSSRASTFVSHSRDSSINGSGSYATSPNSRHPSRRLEAGRPAPLQLSGNPVPKGLPQLIRDPNPPPDSAKSTRPLPFSRSAEPSSTGGGTAPPSRPNTNLPPAAPPPAGKPPPPPQTRSNSRDLRTLSGRKTPTSQSAVPSYVNQPLPQPPLNHSLLTPPTTGAQWAGGYGLPSDPRPGNLGGKTPTRSTSPLQNVPGRDASRSPNPSHTRTSSLANSNGLSARPATNGGHPYASSQSQVLPVPSAQLAHNLSPIAESFVSHISSTSSSTPSPPTAPFTVGRGPFGRPHTPSHTTAPSLDDLRRKLVKFTLADENISRTVDVSDCAGGVEVLEKVLRKFGKLGSKKLDQDSLMELVESVDGGLVLDGWAVFLDWGQDDETARPLSEAALLSVCHADPDDPARQRGLTVRRTGKAKRSKQMAHIYSEQSVTSSPTTSLFSSNRPSTDEEEGSSHLSPSDARPPEAQRVFNKRASSISVLSGLGVKDPEKVLDPPPSPSNGGRKSPASINNKKGPSKLRNFFGQRPPSELITSHLPEYFPFTEKKVLQRTARNSMLRKRDSTASFATQPHSRFSVSTMGSQRRSMSPSRASISSPPPVPEKSSEYLSALQTPRSEDPPRLSLSTEDGQSFDLHPEQQKPKSRRDSKPLLPPVDLSSESFAESMESLTSPGLETDSMSQSQSRLSRRMSYITELRSKKDISDTASLMTVDEITAEVENRRMSKAFPVESAEDWTQVGSEGSEEEEEESDESSEVTVEVEEAEELEEEDEGEGEGEEGEEEVDESAKALMSNGVKRIKWIKGALIGAGSFGKVYLGMDASSGTLMAVKQVELPKSSGPNEQRKRSMLDALDREIELLKTLQHENIVQYLDSSADEEFLNIFLEYVPGGSVAALLREYGSFEEILVKKFVSQIVQGLNYLHGRDIVHRDIKGANILVDNKGGVKISDFGISKKVQDNLLGTGGGRGPRISLQGSVFWMAPEVVKQSAHTIKADVWSLGCLIVEMLTGEHPFPQLNQMQAIFKIGQSAKPTIPPDISAEAADFLQRTFELNHEARPTAGELLEHPWIAQDSSAKVNS
ncbi:Pkinase-domain-containing protein [Heliocybe sulcata]|uniref:Pkinase-domain-containing protein n=1 Tax=Heliocybe sulcata TaxID=5364 RepID=A0A5C3NBK4_9AGAM|nr:Pkinase-domain-containing protein [Heliocybe sulcata]